MDKDPFDCGASTETELARMWLGPEVVAAAQAEVQAGRQADLAAALLATGEIIEPQVDMLRALPKARILGGFELISRIHLGRSAEIHLAREVGSGREAALKVVSRMAEGSSLYRARFEQEGGLTEALEHPHIARCLDRGVSDGRPWMAFELVHGPTLERLLAVNGPIPPLLAVDIAMQVASGLSHAWSSSRLVHRDIRPANLMVERGRKIHCMEGWDEGFGADTRAIERRRRSELPFERGEEVKIISFGLASTDAGDTTGAGSGAESAGRSALGSPAYMPPELIAGQPCDCRSDLYALGATLFHLLTGRTPFHARTVAEMLHRQVHHPAPDPSSLVADLDPAIAALVRRAMAKDPAERFQDPAAFIGAARAILTRDVTPQASLNIDQSAGSDAELARRWLGSEVVAAAQNEVAAGRQADLAAALLAGGAIIEPQAELLRAQPPARFIDRFELVSRLGSGAMGEVHLAREIGTGREAALKVISEQICENRAFLRRFEREGELLATLDHDNIARCLGRGVDQGRPWLAMEYVRGPDLGQVLDVCGRLQPRLAVELAIQVASGLAYAWTASHLVHRDIKPSNLLLERAGRDPSAPPTSEDLVKIIDFGLAKADAAQAAEGSLLTMAGTVMGTPAYMSPEQVDGKECDCRADLYSLGATLYHMLTGRQPYEGRTPIEVMSKHVRHPVPDPARLVADLDPAIAQLVMTAMAKEPGRRHQTPAAFITAARAAIGLRPRGTWAGPAAAPAPVPPPPSTRRIRAESADSPLRSGTVPHTGSGTVRAVRPPVAGAPRQPGGTSSVARRSLAAAEPRTSSSSALRAALTDRFRRNPRGAAAGAGAHAAAGKRSGWMTGPLLGVLAGVIGLLVLAAVVVLLVRWW